MYAPAGVKTDPNFPVPETMKAWVLGEPGQLSLQNKPVPVHKRAEVLVRIERRGDRVLARIENPYVADQQRRVGNRMALENIRERLALFFDADMDAQIRDRRAMQDDLRIAVAERALTLHYQPQVDMAGRPLGFEALATTSLGMANALGRVDGEGAVSRT